MNKIWRLASWLFGECPRLRYSSSERNIYLTFDDGPAPESTPYLLEVLRKYDAYGTFFMIGDHVVKNRAIAKMVLDAGHRLGNHSMTHPLFSRLSTQEQRREVAITEALLAEVDGLQNHPLRPPHGRATLSTIIDCRRCGQPLVLWSYDSMDYRLNATEVVARMRAAPIGPGDILLFHDDGNVAAEALDQLLPIWKREGYRFPVIC